MTIQQLKYAIKIAETGSLNKAAEHLYIAQPSLSNSVKELERELGINVFSRSTKGTTLTENGNEFIKYARQIVWLYDQLYEKYSNSDVLKKKFGISTQHYSFAVKSFVETVKHYGMNEYEFAIRETKTREVIDDVSTGKSEIGILFTNDFNRSVLEKVFRTNDLVFTKLIECDAFVYLWKGHPLADRSYIEFSDLAEYPCLSFEQGSFESFYYSEEILSTADYPRMIRSSDRATMLNLMVGLNGYTLCSGIICEELNGSNYVAIPFKADPDAVGSRMEIGYITKKNIALSNVGVTYIEETKKYLANL